MNSKEKTVFYTATNSYSTLNDIGPKTEYVWIILHGLGQLSRYFLKHFEELDKEIHYLIAPQAPSKYYLNNQYRRVGSSWLTKEETERETLNVMNYLNEVFAQENLTDDYKLIVFGFSQGVSIATRWVARYQIKCHKLVLYAGGLPNELRPEDFQFLVANETRVNLIVGNEDAFISPERLDHEYKKACELFGQSVQQTIFEGGHELKKEIINTLVP